MKEIEVATYTSPNGRGGFYRNAYTRFWNSEWSGFKMYRVVAKNGTEAKKIALKMRKQDDEKGDQ